MMKMVNGELQPESQWDIEQRQIDAQPKPAMRRDVRNHASALMMEFTGARDKEHLEIIISNASREAIRLQQVRVGTPHPLTAGAWIAPPRDWTQEEMLRVAELAPWVAAAITTHPHHH